MNPTDFFDAARRAGFNVLVIQDLHIGDVVTADTIVNGDVNNTTTTTTSLTVPREMLQAPRQDRTVACAPLAEPLHGVWLDAQRQMDDEYAERIANGTLWSKRG